MAGIKNNIFKTVKERCKELYEYVNSKKDAIYHAIAMLEVYRN